MAIELLHIDGSSTDTYFLNRVAQSVIPDADWLVESVWSDLIWSTGDNNMQCRICANATDRPGTILATSDVQVVASSQGAAGPETFNFAPAYLLLSGVTYWFAFYDNASGGFVRWNQVSTQAGVSAHNGSTWSQINDNDVGQFKVNGTVVVSGGPPRVVPVRNLLRRRR